MMESLVSLVKKTAVVDDFFVGFEVVVVVVQWREACVCQDQFPSSSASSLCGYSSGS